MFGVFATGAFAALDVNFTETTDVPVAGITLTISSGSTVDSITFNDNDLSVVLSAGASITINSPDRREINTSPSTYTSSSCTDSLSSITLSMSSGGPVTITVTPLSSTCSSGSAVAPAFVSPPPPAPPSEAPAPETPPAEEPVPEEIPPAETPPEEIPPEEVPAEDIPSEEIPPETPTEEPAAEQPAPSGEVPSMGQIAIGTITQVFGGISDKAVFAARKTLVAAQKTLVVAKKAAKETKKVLNTPAGKTTAKAAVSVSVATAVVQGVKAAVMPNFSSLADIYSMILRLLGLLGEFLGIKKRIRKWGVVYDSVTKRPLDPVYVSILDEKGKEMEQRFTDMEGRFGFLATPGKYRIHASKTHYSFPSLKVSGEKDELYDNVYHGEMLEIGAEEVINVNIPMDPVDIDWNEEAKKEMMKFNPKREIIKKRLATLLFFGGLIMSPIVYWASPNNFNLAIMAVYAGILGLRQVGFKPKNFGRVYDKETKKPVPFAKVIISYPNRPDQRAAFGVSDITGRYFILVVDKGEFLVHITGKTVEGREIDTKFIYTAKEKLIQSDFWV